MLILIMSIKSCGNADHTEIQINYPHKQAKRFDKTKCEKAKKTLFCFELEKGQLTVIHCQFKNRGNLLQFSVAHHHLCLGAAMQLILIF